MILTLQSSSTAECLKKILRAVLHMLQCSAATGIIEKSESDKIVDGLNGILDDIKSGKLEIDMSAEDIHTFVEGELTARLGQTGKRLHTARSRNDQVALDIRMVLKKEN